MMKSRQMIITTLRWVSIVLFALLVLVVVWQVFTRQVLHSPSTWSTTVSQYMFVWLSLFAGAMVFAERAHVAVDFLAHNAPAPVRRVMNICVQLATLTFASIALVWGGMRAIGISWDQAVPGLPVTTGQMYIALPIAGIIIAYVALTDLILALRGEELPALDDPVEDAVAEAAHVTKAEV